jgi:hypothetical protein
MTVRGFMLTLDPSAFRSRILVAGCRVPVAGCRVTA